MRHMRLSGIVKNTFLVDIRIRSRDWYFRIKDCFSDFEFVGSCHIIEQTSEGTMKLFM